ncbi:crotonase/enoyl-CoA hydratase family protein [Gordonia sp. HY442]|uniref:crotonase/enoyl-CoA hydratase family protein n=1 Tax=Gordonia zhenghanii TaxID=2911516 RepID=UPI001F01FC81|nr:crotonase/enoyl-CoA hydratase family protein [Gordonia zhenghanii]MCF8601990.1 crotonase/enoyl-CoA hydratase family protein [Gordonia zhenghanii]MCF8602058.1 crotonase/enoyl-CoA hydratase family protein [Gordonia zhenghanii]
MTAADSAPAVLVEHHDHVAVITINRPDARNAVNSTVADGLGDALDKADTDPEIRAIVLTGAGDKSFCAGADLKAISRGESIDATDRSRRRWGFAGVVTHPISTPLIAAVNGTALGGGTELVLASDLAVAAQSATFGLPEVKRGIIAAAGGAFRIVAALPNKAGMEILLTGRAVSAERAADLGLVNRVVPDAELLDSAIALAHEIAANAPLAVQASKRLALGIVDGEVPTESAQWAANKSEIAAVFTSKDAQEGPRAFAEKREPVWRAE